MQRKLWGWMRRLVDTPTYRVEQIWGLPGGASSLHLHRQQVNLFIVHTGFLVLQYADDRQERVTPASDPVSVPAGLLHRMVFYGECHATEIYAPAFAGAIVTPEDIERMDEGRRGDSPQTVLGPILFPTEEAWP